jgi:hypothetical protein
MVRVFSTESSFTWNQKMKKHTIDPNGRRIGSSEKKKTLFLQSLWEKKKADFSTSDHERRTSD